jgi:hypothetical protein
MFNKKLIEVFELITYTNENPIIFLKGSAKNKNIFYPNDYDFYEVIKTTKTKEGVINELYKIVYDIVKEIIKKDDIYLIEFKMGIDNNFYMTEEQILNSEFRNKFLKDKITNEELDYINSIDDEDELILYCQNLYKLRWNTNDILKKYIKNRGNKIYFNDAFKIKSLIKIDVIAFINNRFWDFSNIFEINKLTEKQDKQNEQKYIKMMKEDIIKYKKQKDFFKALKRLYNIHPNNKKLIDFFNSKTGKTYQLYTNFTTILNLLNYYDNISVLKKIKDSIKFLIVEYDFLDNEILMKMKDIIREGKTRFIIRDITKINNTLLKIINEDTKEFIKTNKIKL